eukprot:maker-scaffold_30-snap-gene-0.7-mRNA-1 protein AED:0.20 eAED:0.20 QI:0/0.33/0.25/0.5/0.66/0.5/4/955/463
MKTTKKVSFGEKEYTEDELSNLRKKLRSENDGIKIIPFNLKAEKRAGYFNENDEYIQTRRIVLDEDDEEEIETDEWLKQLSKNEIAKFVSKENAKVEEKLPEKVCLKNILEILKPDENSFEALSRLGKVKNKELIEKLSEACNTLLQTHSNIYELKASGINSLALKDVFYEYKIGKNPEIHGPFNATMMSQWNESYFSQVSNDPNQQVFVRKAEKKEDSEKTAADDLDGLSDSDDDEEQNSSEEWVLSTKFFEELKVHEFNRRKETLRSQQISERLGLEEAHLLEFQRFNKSWDEKLAEHQNYGSTLVSDLKNKHLVEIQELRMIFIAKQETKNNPGIKGSDKYKPSKELLNLRKVQESLAKQRDYQHAARIKHRADELESNERKRLVEKKNRALEIKEFHLKRKHKNELHALQKKLKATKDSIEKRKTEEVDKLLQRYNNVQNQLLAAQKLQRSKLYRYRRK